MRHPIIYYVNLLRKLYDSKEGSSDSRLVARVFTDYVSSENDTKQLKKILSRFIASEKKRKRISDIRIEVADKESLSDKSLEKKVSQYYADRNRSAVVKVSLNESLKSGMRLVVDQSAEINTSLKNLVGSLFKEQ